MKSIEMWVSIGVSCVAVIVSLSSLRVSRKNIYTNAISQNRMDWIVRVRDLMFRFIEAYIADSTDRKALLRIKTQIDLFLNPADNKYHRQLAAVLQKYTDSSDLALDELTEVCRAVLKERWERIKLETAYSKRHLKRIRERIDM